MSRAAAILLSGLLLANPVLAAPEPAPPGFPPLDDATILPFTALDGWDRDDHLRPFGVFQAGCRPVVDDPALLASARPAQPALVEACRDALAMVPPPDDAGAKAFFERRFEPVQIATVASGRGVLTGYFEPVLEGSLERTDEFATPLLARPDDLVIFKPGEAPSTLPPGVTVARRTPDGFEPYPDRAAIEDGALGDLARPLVYLRDPVDAFTAQVQGSVRVALPDGRSLRLAYGGRNGQPYTSVARLVTLQLGVKPADMTADILFAWLKGHPDEAHDLLRLNRSYVFFRTADELDPAGGPIGAGGVQLTAGRSLAIDRAVWSYGLPVWLEGDTPEPGGSGPLRRLTIAQDTGTAIVGAARGDLFVGGGSENGMSAGRINMPVRFVVLWPRAAGPAAP